MLLVLQGLLAPPEVTALRQIAAEGEFVDGAVSSPGLAAAGIKRNEHSRSPRNSSGGSSRSSSRPLIATRLFASLPCRN